MNRQNIKNNLPPIVCFAGSDWWYHNRGLMVVRIMSQLALHTKVLFINSLGMRIPSLRKDKHALKLIFRKIKSILKFLRKDKESGMYIVSPLSVPFQNKFLKKINNASLIIQVKFIMILLGIRKPIFYFGNLPAWEIAKHFQYSYLIYECSDLFHEMPGADKNHISYLNDLLIKKSDLVIYVNTILWRNGLILNKNSLLLGHGVDYDLFEKSSNINNTPEDLVSIPGPIIGFYGDISTKTSDFLLLEHIAKNIPDMSLVMIGPLSSDVSKLKEYSNIYFLGQKPYNEIPYYGNRFDVAIMAWNKNKWIEHCNPVKLKEYLALGKPVVTVYFPEIEPYKELVYVSENYDDFILNIRKAVNEDELKFRIKRKESVRNETWEKKTRQLINLIMDDIES
jgi:glycosyltransferase involved in cell wall biosynthesis